MRFHNNRNLSGKTRTTFEARRPLGLAVLISFLMIGAIDAQVFVYRGKIDDTLIEGIGRRYKEVQVGDFNEDGWPDIYAAQKQCAANQSNCQSTTGTNKDRVYLNQGTGSFSPLTGLLSPQSQSSAFNNLITNRGYDVEVGDFDGDDHVDIVRPDVGRVDMLWGNGTGQFEPTNVVTSANDPNSNGNYDDIAILDIDIDGDLDILVAQYNTGVNLLLRNRHQQGNPRVFDIETFGSADLTHTVSVADFNTDGILDVTFARPNGNSELLRGAPPACDPFYSRELFLDPPNSPNPTTVNDFVDFDGDGLLDLYVARGVFSNDPLGPGERQHYVYFQNSSGTFSTIGAPVGAGDPSIYDARYADVDLDGRMEILRVNIHTNSQNSTLQAVRVHPNRTFTDVTSSFFGGVWRGEMGVELADLDRDGDLDLVLAGSTDNTGNLSAGDAAIHIYENVTIQLPSGTNRPPTAEPDLLVTSRDTSLAVALGHFLGNDSDPDGDGLWYNYDLVTQMGGTNDTGHLGGFNYTPPPGFVGVDRMHYLLQDTPNGSGGEAIGTITFIVTDPDCGAPPEIGKALDFSELTIQGYGGRNQAGNPAVSVEDGGATLHISGNGWRKISLPYTVTSNTVLEFDYRSSAQGEVQGIGFDTDNTLSANRFFKVYGTQAWGIQDYNDYAGSAPATKHYRIPVGQHFTGDQLYLTFGNDHDVAGATGESYFSNVRVYEADQAVLDFNGRTLEGYGGPAQAGNPTVTIEDGGATLRLVGNGWRKIRFPYPVTSNTILEFDYRSSAQGEVQGVGFDIDDGLSSNRVFKVYGTQAWGIRDFDDYAGSAPNTKRYVIPVGQYFTGDQLYLTFANDHDVVGANGESVFSNILIHE